MTEIIAQCQVPPTPTSLSLSPTLSQTISLSSLPLGLLPFSLNFSSTDKGQKIRLPHTVGDETRTLKRDNHGKPINSNSISKTHKRSLTYAARGVMFGTECPGQLRGPFKRNKKRQLTAYAGRPRPSKRVQSCIEGARLPKHACTPVGDIVELAGDPMPRASIQSKHAASLSLYPPPGTPRVTKKNNNNTRSYDSANPLLEFLKSGYTCCPDPAGFCICKRFPLSLSLCHAACFSFPLRLICGAGRSG